MIHVSVVVPQLNQAYQQHLTVDGHSWSQLSLFGPFRFWTTGANKTDFWNKSCRGAEDVNQPKESGLAHTQVLMVTDTTLYCPLIRPPHCHFTVSFGKLINRSIYSSIEEGVKQRGGDGWRGSSSTAALSKDTQAGREITCTMLPPDG